MAYSAFCSVTEPLIGTFKIMFFVCKEKAGSLSKYLINNSLYRLIKKYNKSKQQCIEFYGTDVQNFLLINLQLFSLIVFSYNQNNPLWLKSKPIFLKLRTMVESQGLMHSMMIVMNDIAQSELALLSATLQIYSDKQPRV